VITLDSALTAVLLRGHTRISRLSSLDPLTLATVRTWDLDERIVVGGSFSRDRTRQVRGTSSLSLVDRDGTLAPREIGDHFYAGSIVRYEVGIGGTYIPLATHVIDSHSGRMTGSLDISGQDRLSLALQDFGEVATGDAGERVGTVIRRWLAPVLGDDDALWSVDDGGRGLGTLTTAAEDDERLARAAQLAVDFGLELYADRSGVIVIRPLPDPVTATSVMTYTPGPLSTLIALERSGSAHPYNRFIVVGESLDPARPAVRGEYRITNPAHPLHEDRIGLRTAPVLRSSDITEQDVANARAYVGLQEASSVEEAVSIELVPDPRLDEGDVLTVEEARSGAIGRYRIDSINMPATLGAMSITATRTRSLV
jgi:hypothetical protein